MNIMQGMFIICIIMQALHNMHNNARVCMIGIIVGIKKLCRHYARDHAEITQKLWPCTRDSCRAHCALAGAESNYANYSNHANDIIMQIINIPCIIGIINTNMQFMRGDPGRSPEPTQVSTA